MITDAEVALLTAKTYTDPATWTGVDLWTRDGEKQNFQAYLHQQPGLVAIGFRGTETTEEWAADFLALAIEDHDVINHEKLGHVHWGFLEATKSVYSSVYASAKAANAAGTPVLLHGHSLGGAMAHMASALLTVDGIKISSVVTFAPPRCGFKSFMDILNTIPGTSYRFGNDPVPEVPSWMMQRTLIPIGSARPGWDGAKSCHSWINYQNSLEGIKES